MGMSGGQVLRRVELPLALPMIMLGLRLAAVQVVATATIAALIGGGGLGRFVVDGLAQHDQPQVVGGAVGTVGGPRRRCIRPACRGVYPCCDLAICRSRPPEFVTSLYSAALCGDV
jgi:hypothetical protein